MKLNLRPILVLCALLIGLFSCALAQEHSDIHRKEGPNKRPERSGMNDMAEETPEDTLVTVEPDTLESDLVELDLIEMDSIPEIVSACDETAIKKFLTDRTTFLGMQPDLNYRRLGVKVALALENTPAARARIRKDDIITKVDGHPVASFSELRTTLAEIPTGKKYPVELTRSSRKMQLFVVAESHAENYHAIREVHCKRTCGCAPVPDRELGTFFDTRRGQVLVTVEAPNEAEKNRLIASNQAYNAVDGLVPQSMKLYPDGKSGDFKLDLALAEPNPVLLYVFNREGKAVYFEHIKDFAGGKLSREVDLTNLPKGTYYLQVTQKGKSITRKIEMD